MLAGSYKIRFDASKLRTTVQGRRRSTFECDSPTTLSKLKPGRHTFSVIAMDRAGNDSQPVSQTFTVKKKK